MAESKMLRAIENSTNVCFIKIPPKTLAANEREWPTVKAVISINSFFQCLNGKVRVSKVTNKMWS